MHSDAEERNSIDAILGSVFGNSDSDSENDSSAHRNFSSQVHGDHMWKRIDVMQGLWICKSFMSSTQQDKLLSEITAEGWFIDRSNNQAMRFKDLPKWASELSSCIYHAVCSFIFADDSLSFYSSPENDATNFPFGLDLLSRVPLFDQMIVNQYNPGEGICAHVDLLQFEDGIAILSLESTCVMHFARLSKESSGCQYNYQARDLKEFGIRAEDKIPILLEPGDLILLSNEARYGWTHEINRSEDSQVWKGKKIIQSKRTSVTLRKLITQTEGIEPMINQGWSRMLEEFGVDT